MSFTEPAYVQDVHTRIAELEASLNQSVAEITLLKSHTDELLQELENSKNAVRVQGEAKKSARRQTLGPFPVRQFLDARKGIGQSMSATVNQLAGDNEARKEQAWRYGLRTNKLVKEAVDKCACEYHRGEMKELFAKAADGTESFAAFSCCAKVNLASLSVKSEGKSRSEQESKAEKDMETMLMNKTASLSQCSRSVREEVLRPFTTKPIAFEAMTPSHGGAAWCRRKTCSTQRCSDCGVDRRFGASCPVEFTANPTLQIKVRTFREASRASRTQRLLL